VLTWTHLGLQLSTAKPYDVRVTPGGGDMKSAGFAIGLIAMLVATDARAIVGGVEVAADDPGGQATVIVSRKDGSCSGLVYGESYIITNAHCLMNKDFTATIAPRDVTVIYGRGLKQPDAVVRQVTALAIHQNFLRLFSGTDEYIIDSEDIALMRIAGTHPSGALGAELPTITNDYVVCCVPRARSWPLVWMDVYGYGAAPKGEVLHKLRASAVAPDAVWKGVDPKGLYRPRQLGTEEIGSAGGPHGICHGDSGGPAHRVACGAGGGDPPRARPSVRHRARDLGK
jgi:hypothetical protein